MERIGVRAWRRRAQQPWILRLEQRAAIIGSLDSDLPAPVSRSEAGRVRLLLILGALNALAPLSVDAYLPGLPSLRDDLSTSASAAQLTLTACLLGLAAGQLLAGPLSDVLGRRRPLLIGLAAYAAASLLCALAPSVWALIALRLVQGAAGAAGIAIARAVARDLYEGVALARFFGLMVLVTGAAPILAPTLGSLILRVGSWRDIFLALTAGGALLLAAVAVGLPESLPVAERRPSGLRATFTVFRDLLADRVFVGYTLACGLPFAAMFAYIAGSPFVIQDVYGLSPLLFGVIFGVNAFGIIASAQLGTRLAIRVQPRRLLTSGLLGCSAGGVALLASILLDAGLWGLLIPLFVVCSSIGIVLPNATALALAGDARTAGSASGLLGVIQFVIGGATAPLVGVAGTGTALPMGILIALFGVASVASVAFLTRS